MQVEVTFLTRRGPDAVMRKSQTVTADIVRFGRGTDNEVQLPDIRVGLHAAALARREPGLFVERAGEELMRVNGASTASSSVRAGDKISIGPYEIVVVAPGPGFDAALTIELVHPLGDALERLTAQNRLSLAQAGWSKRHWSWALFVLLAIVGLVIPLSVYPFGEVATSSRTVAPFGAVGFITMSWNAGEVSNAHRFFAQDCATCHRGPLVSVADTACLACHATVGGHLEADADLGPSRPQLAATRCATCHEEHRGVHSLVISAQALCVDCHANLAETAPKAGILNATSFPAGHPQFRATVVADAAKPSFARVSLAASPPPQDRSNLVFSHAAHLIETGFLTPNGRKIMTCADCHKAEPSGQGFQPVTFEGQCHSCHDLKFDAALPWREVPHGDAVYVQNAVTDFYAHMALQGGVQDPDAPAFVRRPVGTPVEPTETERGGALAWAALRASAAMGIIYDDKRGCAYCHVTDHADGKFTVAPVVLRARFLPNAAFDHARHQALNCADCHDARHSEKSGDVLLPRIETCVDCHGSERAGLKTQSTCTSCHLFHRQEFGPMKTANTSP
ncbi:MAG TPA: cytochrome c3 family protein [Stellaceae bacterium]|nr:cytochrome c3 family protein [Stellaceae bacterium]